MLSAQEKLSKEEKARREKNIQAGNPFAKYGSKAPVATLSKGKYLEVHDLDSIVTIGTSRWHVDNKKIVGDIIIDSLNVDAQPIGDAPGRWMSPDPLSEEFPDWSPYNFVFNSPLKYNDPTGMAPEDIIIIGSGNQQLKYENGNLFNKDGTAYTGKIDNFTQKTVTALEEISKSAEGASMIQELQSSKNIFTIEKGSSNSFTPNSNLKSFANIPEIQLANPAIQPSTGSGGKIVFNPNSMTSGLNTAGNTNRPSYIGLGHEMFHGRDSNNGVLYPYTDYNTFKAEDKGLYKSEWRAVFYENTVRAQLGLPLRTHYGINDDGQGNITPVGPNLLDNNKKPINYTIK
ncbi:hypothetical protein BWK60_13370 [Flavobacterium covae]|nr:hypothetical protein BWK60_13370 [Flavobacterium covae]